MHEHGKRVALCIRSSEVMLYGDSRSRFLRPTLHAKYAILRSIPASTNAWITTQLRLPRRLLTLTQFPRRGGSSLSATMKFGGEGCRNLCMGISCLRKIRKALSHRSRGEPLLARAVETPAGKLVSRVSRLERRELSRKPSSRRSGCKRVSMPTRWFSKNWISIL